MYDSYKKIKKYAVTYKQIRWTRTLNLILKGLSFLAETVITYTFWTKNCIIMNTHSNFATFKGLPP